MSVLPVSTRPVSNESPSQCEGNTRTSVKPDWWLIGAVGLLAGLGLLVILSASSLMADSRYSNSFHFVLRQGIALSAGALGAAVLMRVPTARLRQFATPAYVLAVIALVLVLTPLGRSAYGSARWINLGFFNFQPSEFAKFALILAFSNHLARNEGRIADVAGVVLPGLIVWGAPVILLVYLEPDFLTSVLMSSLLGVLLYVGGLRWRWMLSMGAVALAALGAMLVAEPYRVRRLTSFLDPFSDPENTGYQVIQGWIALASGGFTGQGMASGLAQRGFLPEAHTDFIAAVVGEEFGAVGWVLMLAIYGVILWRCVRITFRSPTFFGVLLGSALTTLIAFQVIVNLCVVVSWFPPTGLVLPFLSYGATAVVFHMLAVGILLRLHIEAEEADQIGAAVPG